jgi:hypothetical protein
MDQKTTRGFVEKNVIDLGKWKEMKVKQGKVEGYQNYLKSLPHSQLETEIDYLLDSYEEESYFLKAQLILKEITSRAHSNVRKKIEQLKDENLWQ